MRRFCTNIALVALLAGVAGISTPSHAEIGQVAVVFTKGGFIVGVGGAEQVADRMPVGTAELRSSVLARFSVASSFFSTSSTDLPASVGAIASNPISPMIVFGPRKITAPWAPA